jgi:cobalt-precorrin 5A hydrolase
MIVAGLGFRTGVTADELLQTLEDAAQLGAIGLAEIRKLATLASKLDEAGLLEAARRLRLPVDAIEPAQLRAKDGEVETRSARVEDLHSVGSVCEAAALAAAGPGARLRLARITGARTACALAEGPDP